MRISLILALVFIAGFSFGDQKPPNVILMLIDDMGWTDLGCYGSKFYQTPHIDQLAKDGMRFTQAYSACTVCSPSRAAIMTGKYPARLHITDWIAGHERPFAKLKIPEWQKFLPLEEETIAERLKTKGYATASVGKWHLGPEEFWPTHQGFDLNVAGADIGSPPSYFSPYKMKTLADGPDGEFLTDRLTREAMKFIDSSKDKPFFIYLPHYAVHTPLMAKKEVIEKYRNIPATPQHNSAVYAGLIESVDDSVGALRSQLSQLGLADNTVFIFTSDNGGLSHIVSAQGWRRQSTDNSPSRLGKGSSFDGGVHIPLIVSWPGHVKPGTTCDTPVISCDHYPTILELTGIQAKEGHAPDGESLMPLLTQSGSLKRDAIYWHYPHYHPGSATPYSAVREGDWKLIEFLEDSHLELYNIKRDPGESDNVTAENTEKTSSLKAKLDAWRKEVGAQMPTRNPAYDPDKAWDGGREGGPKGKGKGKGKKAAE